MDDYISREAAYKTLTEYYHHSSGVQHTVLREALNRVPTADVAPVVRCKDCKHWHSNGSDWCSCDRDALIRHKDFFCAAGELGTNCGEDMEGGGENGSTETVSVLRWNGSH